MRRLGSAWRALGVLAGGLLLGCSALAQNGGADIGRLAWLAGCWRVDGADLGSVEHWLPAAGGSMAGVSRTVRRGVAVAHEFMQIRETAEGPLMLLLQPAGRGETAYAYVPGAVREAVFENRGADFPQRLGYRLDDGGRLLVRMEGTQAGLPRTVDWTLSRSACEALPGLPEAFQGLPWGATEAQIERRFGARLKPAECNATSRALAQRRGEACEHPTLAPYEVAGIPMRLDLHLDAQSRQLVRVTLSYGAQSAAAAASEDSGWGERHRLLRRLLTQRYGGPEATHVDSEAEATQATARWRRGDSLIELNSVFQPRTATAAAREQVEIIYQPVTAGDAGKL